MDHGEPIFDDPAGEMHAEIIRRRAAELRKVQRDYAVVLADRGWTPSRIAEFCDIAPLVVVRMVAADGVRNCTECTYGYHHNCVSEMVTNDGRIVECECTACRI